MKWNDMPYIFVFMFVIILAVGAIFNEVTYHKYSDILPWAVLVLWFSLCIVIIQSKEKKEVKS